MEQEIESALRSAPKPSAPAGLKEQLINQVRLPRTQPTALSATKSVGFTSWLRRWWPALAPAAVSVACAVGLSVQQAEIRHLKQAVRELSRDVAAQPGTPSLAVPKASAVPASRAEATEREIARLKEVAAKLADEVRQLEQMRVENVKLRSQLLAPPPGLLSPEETEEISQAREKAQCIACMNNLKQFGLAVRMWALDNGDVAPPDIVCISNELNTPKILVCPADTGREAARDFNSFTAANCSYEYLGASAPDNEPMRVISRCPIHGNIGLCDGSVQARIAKLHPEKLVQRDGKLYMEDPSDHLPRTPVPQPEPQPPRGSNQ